MTSSLAERVRAGGPIASWAASGPARLLRLTLGFLAAAIGAVAGFVAWAIGAITATGCWMHCDQDPAPISGAAVGSLLMAGAAAFTFAALWWAVADRHWRRAVVVILLLALLSAVPTALALHAEGHRLLG